MADENKLNIRLHLYDTDMMVRVDRAEEELYRKSAQLITEVLGSYSQHYKGAKSEKDIMYMALVDISLRYERESKRNDVTPYSDMLEKLTGEIKEALGEE